jgi:hypothetical protein
MQQPTATTDSKRLLFASIVKDFRFSWKELALARSVLEQRWQMSSLERLLVEASTLFGVRPKSNLTIDDF